MTTNGELRDWIRQEFDADQVLIKRNGQIHVHGRMPNSIETGWYLLGDRAELVKQWDDQVERMLGSV
jgi:hypothetical protein